ncbi:MAG: DinB family protein [Balneolaceae bacterium]
MDERQKIQQLFQFDLWCNRRLAGLVMDEAPFPELETCISLLSHIINAQEIWFYRVVKIPAPDIVIWGKHEPEELTDKAEQAHQKWVDLIGDHEADLETEIHYAKTKGQNFQNSLWQIAHHLIIHGQHHRAQISLLLRKCDIVPPPIDYIYYTRLDL